MMVDGLYVYVEVAGEADAVGEYDRQSDAIRVAQNTLRIAAQDGEFADHEIRSIVKRADGTEVGSFTIADGVIHEHAPRV